MVKLVFVVYEPVGNELLRQEGETLRSFDCKTFQAGLKLDSTTPDDFFDRMDFLHRVKFQPEF